MRLRLRLPVRALRNAPLRRLLIVVLIVAAYQGWLSVQAVGKADPGVGARPDPQGRFPVDVVLGFPPERYHMLQLQKHGRLRGTEGTVVHLRSVSPAGVDALARMYWVKSIRSPGAGG
ncbi:hypothetical protein GCM10023085_52260 [Actinomadura viridis]|uniref:Uncharacterized protein n=1 Tax=Actinomadura viridis TaxID=58110 RepID=A0A931GMP2_9ACTN|nr:hypothetical protein [Actinomadura viridis]MBG6092195.1 hypothetical protein [Actinomadura viridis]